MKLRFFDLTPSHPNYEEARKNYEADCLQRPKYPDGTRRRTFEELSPLVRSSWQTPTHGIAPSTTRPQI